jgi:hypothetical protein
LTLLLGAGRLDEFYNQFISLLHAPASAGMLGELRCRLDEKYFRISIVETAPSPDFAWEVLKVTTEGRQE